MNEIVQDSFGWDVVNWSRALGHWESALGRDDLSGTRVLEVGCGALNGGMSLWFASKGAEVLATSNVDVSREMSVFHDKHELRGSIDYETVDLTSMPFEGAFEVVCFKSVLGGVFRGKDEKLRMEIMEGMARALKEGGRVLFAENLISSSLHQFLRNRFGAGRSQWNYFTKAELKQLFEDAGFSDVKIDSTGFFGAFGRTEWQRRACGRLDAIVSRIVPHRFHYIGYGSATWES